MATLNRFWDKNQQYTQGLIKAYTHWSLEVSYRQHTLGCFIIFARREGVQRISELEAEELNELKIVMGAIEKALSANPLFQPDRFNYWQMGNAVHHLHFHGIPRYKENRQFGGKTWIDPSWGTIPTWLKVEVKEQLVKTLREEIKTYI